MQVNPPESAAIPHLRAVASQLLEQANARDVAQFFESLAIELQGASATNPLRPIRTPYLNTIPPENEPDYPGDLELEARIENLVRWNAMAMVVKANRRHSGIGGHISTFASIATLYEVGFQHHFRGPDGDGPADQIYFQGHASPGNYARAFLEGRLDEARLTAFRQELVEGGGLPSYPHPRLMPEFWQFPTVSMGLGPVMSIYQARFNRYLEARGIPDWETEPRVWAFIGDGEMDEPESTSALTLAAREGLDNLTWVVNCNLQRLDGPVRGNAKIIQEMEGLFRGAGWNVIKVIWGRDWDPLFASDHDGKLTAMLEQLVDGELQRYVSEPGSRFRHECFSANPDLADRVAHLSDAQLQGLTRGGHDPVKIHAAYQAAVQHRGAPTVILAQTIKGHGLGESGEASNVAHQQKKLDERGLRDFRDRFHIPIDDAAVVEVPFYRPDETSDEIRYLKDRREQLGGSLPARRRDVPKVEIPGSAMFEPFLKAHEEGASTTLAFVRLLSDLMREKGLGGRIVPIIPDEARTFGVDALFRQAGIYAARGQCYKPVDREHLLYYREEEDGQILEEGITEAGSMSSFIAAGTAGNQFGEVMIPFYLFYSMFGFQRVGDLIWAAGDMEARGFLLGATAGRTTLNGEGLQHQDGHSLLLASTHPSLLAYDPAFACEMTVIVEEGLRRMFEEGERLLYYLTVYNESYPMPALPEGSRKGILQGLYRYHRGEEKGPRVHLFGSGTIMQEVLRAREILVEQVEVSVDVWSATSYHRLRNNALEVERWNRLHPDRPRTAWLTDLLSSEEGPFIAVSDFIKAVPGQIANWVPGGLTTLGTDGFGRSDTRGNLRRHFEVDAESIVLAALDRLAHDGAIAAEVVHQAVHDLPFDPDKPTPEAILT